MTGCEAISRASPFLQNNDNKGERAFVSTPTHGGGGGLGYGPRPKNGSGRKTIGFSLNKKLRGPSNRRKPASFDQTVEGGGDAFLFQRLYSQKFSTISKNHEPMQQLKRSSITVLSNLCPNVQGGGRW
jgi:hypothetical protein